MDRLTHSTGRQKNLEQNLNRFDGDASNSEPTSTSQNKTTPPTLRNVVENNGKIIAPFIQLQEQKNRKSINNADEDSSSFVGSSSDLDSEVFSSNVEPSSGSSEVVKHGFIKTYSEITLSSRPSSTQEKNDPIVYDTNHIHFFKQMPKEVIREILLEHVVDLNHIHATAKNLMNFANVSKFNREFVRELLAEDGMQGVSFEITKLAIPNLLDEFAKGKKAEFTQADVDELVHNYPYLTLDCSYKKKSKLPTIGLEGIKIFLHHPDLQGIRIINKVPKYDFGINTMHRACNDNGLELIYSLLNRKKSNPLKFDFIFNNWMPPFDSNYQINENSFEFIKKIQDSAENCSGVTFGELNLKRSPNIGRCYLFGKNDPSSIQAKDYQFKFVKIMCNIALTYSAHSISLEGLQLSDQELGLIINEIQLFDKPTLQYLDLSGNHIDEVAFTNLIIWLQSGKTGIKTLIINSRNLTHYELDLLHGVLKNNHHLESIGIRINFDSSDHPITKDKRVEILFPEPVW